MSLVEIHSQQDRSPAGAGGLRACDHLGHHPRWHARIIGACNTQYGWVSASVDYMVIRTDRVEVLESLDVADVAELGNVSRAALRVLEPQQVGYADIIDSSNI